MVIFIKSFNRPYYLDRCLSSIEQFVTGANEICVLDDGTPKKYLEKIKAKYPQVKILRSEMAEEKEAKILRHANEGVPVTGLKIPSKFWLESIFKLSHDYFLLLEDDMWITEKMDANHFRSLMEEKDISAIKLNHFDNPRLTKGKKTPLDKNVYGLEPDLVSKNPWVFQNIIIKNPFKILSILRVLNLYDPLSKINYYSLYTVAGAFYNKKYYRYIWDSYTDISTEDGQLYKTLRYKKETNTKFAFTKEKFIRTSFSSSATNTFKDIPFDVFEFCKILNDNWLIGNIDSMENYPEDFSEKFIEKQIEKSENLQFYNWKKWSQRFKNQYISVGHKID